MARYGVKWTKEIDDFILANIPCKNKQELLDKINEKFSTNFTKSALTTNCCSKGIQLGIKPWQNNSGRFRGKESYSVGTERVKKGYVRIKIAMPDVWKQKQVYLYEKANNVEVDKHKDTVIFLDGNNRNFDISNLYLLPRRYMSQLNIIRKKTDSAEVVLQKIQLIELKEKMLDVAEEIGEVSICRKKDGTCFRRLKSKVREEQKKRWAKMTVEEKIAFKKKVSKRARERRAKLKAENPSEYEKFLEESRKRCREWARQKRLQIKKIKEKELSNEKQN